MQILIKFVHAGLIGNQSACIGLENSWWPSQHHTIIRTNTDFFMNLNPLKNMH